MATYVLTVAPHRREKLLWAAEHLSPEISEAVPVFSVGRRHLVVFASFQEGAITHIAEGRRGNNAATGSVRLHMRNLEELTRPFSFTEIANAVPARVRAPLQLRFEGQGGLLPPKTDDAFLDYMVGADDRVAEHLAIRGMDADSVRGFRPRIRRNLALQKDALNVALRIGGIGLEPLVEWQPASVDRGTRFFLEGVPGARSLENDALLNDYSTLPGFDLIRKSHPAVAHFRGSRTEMTVIMADQRPLEQQTGVDLIYFNETYRSFAMVQYKAMEAATGGATFRWQPGDRFTQQIDRMNSLWEHIKDESAENRPEDFRFSHNPFFLKFFTRTPLSPSSKGMFPGLYLPLGLWTRLCLSEELKGPKGGNLLTHANVGRWLSNSDFIQLVSRSWVGTSLSQSAMLERVIQEAWETGQTKVLAIKRDLEITSLEPHVW